MTKKGFLKAAFVAAAIGVLAFSGPIAALALVGAAAAAQASGKVLSAAGTAVLQKLKLIKSNNAYPSAKGETLTAGEAALAESILGKKMRPERVKKYLSSTEKANVSAETYGPNSVKFFGVSRHEADYSKPQDISNAGVFIGEMVTVFREQNTGLLSRAFRNVFRTKKSGYDLTEKSRFERFGNAQQASIVQDYMQQFIYRENAPQMDVEKVALLKKVVEKSFPQARRTRLAVETQQRRNAGAPVKAEAVRFPIVIH